MSCNGKEKRDFKLLPAAEYEAVKRLLSRENMKIERNALKKAVGTGRIRIQIFNDKNIYIYILIYVHVLIYLYI